jgi:hypothetical protein
MVGGSENATMRFFSLKRQNSTRMDVSGCQSRPKIGFLTNFYASKNTCKKPFAPQFWAGNQKAANALPMLKFWKYQGAGNDFVMLDQRQKAAIGRGDTALIERLCDRRFGIGADGLILLQNHAGYDFEMVYFNADGRESTMCGNGGRCIAAFAQHLGIVGATCRFTAIDGAHAANITAQNEQNSWVELQMTNVQSVEKEGDNFVLNTGSPHFVRFVESVPDLDVVAEGAIPNPGNRRGLTSILWPMLPTKASKSAPTSAGWKTRRWLAARA